MADDQKVAGDASPRSDFGDDYPCDGYDRLSISYSQILQILDTRKKLGTLPVHEQVVPKLDKTISEMVEKLGNSMLEIDWKKEKFDNGDVIDMLYRSTVLVERLSKLEELKSTTGGISEFVDRLVVVLGETHLEKEY